MGIESVHPEYLTGIRIWKKCRDVYMGSDAVKDAGKAYLPKLSGQDKDEYNAYKERALFYSIMSKSISSLIGLAFSTPPTVTRSSDFDYLFIDKSGDQFLEVMSKALREMLISGRVGWLNDRQDGQQAVPILYKAEAIRNWYVKDNQLQWAVLEEPVISFEDDDKFKQTATFQYRHLYLDKDGRYTQQVYDSNGDSVGVPKLITNAGRPMTYIPFFVANVDGIGFNVTKSPSQDLAEVNLSHYRSSADLEHGRHYTALPTPVITGVDSSTVLKIGSSTAWALPSEKANAKYLEFTGQGLKSLENALVEKAEQLANLSARLIDNSKNGSESPEVVRLRYASEGADLAATMSAIETLANIGYKSIADMENLDSTGFDIELNKQFFDARMSFDDLQKLVTTYLSGGISQETFIFNLKRGEILPPNSDGIGEGQTKNNGDN